MSDDIQRTLGEHSEQLKALKEGMRGIATDVKTLVALENQRKGTMKAVTYIAGVVGAVSSAAVSAAIALWPK